MHRRPGSKTTVLLESRDEKISGKSVSRDIHQIVLKIASLCNLNCSYCYVYNAEDTSYRLRPKTITDAVYDSLLDRMKEYSDRRDGHSFSISFHGGEPTLVGSLRFDQLVERAQMKLGKRLNGIALQTNATLLDARWAEILRRLEVGVSVSLDGPAAAHDMLRVDHSGRGSHNAVVRGIRVLQDAGIRPNVLCVVNPRSSGGDVYHHLRSLGIYEMDFLMPDVSHDNKERLFGGLGTTPVGDYLVSALDAWLEEDDDDVSIRIFVDLFRSLMGHRGVTDCFGNTGSSYIIVETDGAIESNDALRVCADGITKSGLNVLDNDLDEVDFGVPLFDQARNGFPLPTACRRCPERRICGGGYLPHRYSKENGFDNPSVWCQDILMLLSRIRQYLDADVESC